MRFPICIYVCIYIYIELASVVEAAMQRQRTVDQSS